MTTFAIIALTVLGTIVILLFILWSIGTRVSNEEMDADGWAYEIFDGKAHYPKFEDLPDSLKVIYRSHSETKKELTDNELEEESDCLCIYQTYASGKTRIIFECNNCKNIFKAIPKLHTEPISDYKKNIPEYKAMIDKTPNKFLDFHFQNSIRDEQYELSRYISNVAKERGITLKAELN